MTRVPDPGRTRRRAPARRAAGAALALALTLLPAAPGPRACGVCLEDKMAATYDAGVVVRARARGHAVAFVALSGVGLPLTAGDARALRRLLDGLAGVDAGTARVSAEHAAASFAFDPARRALAGVLGEARPRLAARRLVADSLRVLGGPVRPAPARSTTTRRSSPPRPTATLRGQVAASRTR